MYISSCGSQQNKWDKERASDPIIETDVRHEIKSVQLYKCGLARCKVDDICKSRACPKASHPN